MSFSDWTERQLRERLAEYRVQMAGDLTPDERIIFCYSAVLLEQALAEKAVQDAPKRLVFGVDPPPQLPALVSGGKVRKRR